MSEDDGRGAVAQWLEPITHNDADAGSIPAGPTRVRLSRAKGWRKPENTIVVARPSRWGNPYQVKPCDDGGWKVIGGGLMIWGDEGFPMTRAEAVEIAVERFRDLRSGSYWEREAEIHLAGHNLACWCPLDQPCHADVLLELANA